MSGPESLCVARLERNVMSTKESQDTFPAATATTAADKLNRSMSAWNSFTLGFAVVSPVVGLYAIIGVQTVVTGGRLVCRAGHLSGAAAAGGNRLC